MKQKKCNKEPLKTWFDQRHDYFFALKEYLYPYMSTLQLNQKLQKKTKQIQ